MHIKSFKNSVQIECYLLHRPTLSQHGQCEGFARFKIVLHTIILIGILLSIPDIRNLKIAKYIHFKNRE